MINEEEIRKRARDHYHTNHIWHNEKHLCRLKKKILFYLDWRPYAIGLVGFIFVKWGIPILFF